MQPRVCIDLRDSEVYTDNSKKVLKINLKIALTRKMRLRVRGYLQGDYMYLKTECRLTIKYKTNSIAK